MTRQQSTQPEKKRSKLLIQDLKKAWPWSAQQFYGTVTDKRKLSWVSDGEEWNRLQYIFMYESQSGRLTFPSLAQMSSKFCNTSCLEIKCVYFIVSIRFNEHAWFQKFGLLNPMFVNCVTKVSQCHIWLVPKSPEVRSSSLWKVCTVLSCPEFQKFSFHSLLQIPKDSIDEVDIFTWLPGLPRYSPPCWLYWGSLLPDLEKHF